MSEIRFLPSRDMREDVELERQEQAAREVTLRPLELAWPEVARCQRSDIEACALLDSLLL